MLQSLLVTVPSMYWPSTLVTVQLFSTLYPDSVALSSSGRISARAARTARAALGLTRSRLKVFTFAFLICFIYQFLPLLFFPTLTSFATLCLIDNRSWLFRTLGSAYTGLGLLNFSFDWSSIGTNGPLYTPFWALGNYFAGLIAMCWVVSQTQDGFREQADAEQVDHSRFSAFQSMVRLTDPSENLVDIFRNARDFPEIATSRLYNSTYQT